MEKKHINKYGIKVLKPGATEAVWLKDGKYKLTSMRRTEIIYISENINEVYIECNNRSARWSPTYKYYVEEMTDE